MRNCTGLLFEVKKGINEKCSLSHWEKVLYQKREISLEMDENDVKEATDDKRGGGEGARGRSDTGESESDGDTFHLKV